MDYKITYYAMYSSALIALKHEYFNMILRRYEKTVPSILISADDENDR